MVSEERLAPGASLGGGGAWPGSARARGQGAALRSRDRGLPLPAEQRRGDALPGETVAEVEGPGARPPGL